MCFKRVIYSIHLQLFRSNVLVIDAQNVQHHFAHGFDGFCGGQHSEVEARVRRASSEPALDTISEENTVDTVLGNPDTTAYINTISCNITAVRVSGYSCLDCIQRHSVITHQDWKVAAEQILSSQN